MAYEAQIARIRERAGLPPDPESDAIWVRRINSGSHSLEEAKERIRQKATSGTLDGGTRSSSRTSRREIATIRQNLGLPPDPASDDIWVRRINSGAATLADARRRIEAKAVDFGTFNPDAPAPPDDPEPFNFRRAAAGLFPFLPRQLLDTFANSWQETGDPDMAITEVRQSPAYRDFFPGNLRDDGTVRLDEQTYFAQHEAFRLELTSYGMNPDALDHVFPSLVEGGVGPEEFRRRMASIYTDIAGNLTAVQEFYAQQFGAGNLSIQSLIGSALDPSMNPAALERNIRLAQIGGEGRRAGFNLDLAEVERLHSFGLDQAASRQFFTQAQTLLPTLGTLIERHNDPDDEFTLEELGEALIMGDPDQREQIDRLFSQERSLFSPLGLFSVGQGGVVSGLRQR